MYSPNNKTKAISARMAPGLTERIDFECAQHPYFITRNRFLNDAAGLLLDIIHEVRVGNASQKDLPPSLQRVLRYYGVVAR